ncbi:MAG: glycosyltransferase family 39 protein, partial [Candidatus Bathyarchaeia archaeon]
MPIPEMMRATAADRSPFLYYLLLHFWIWIAGESEWALRWPSLAFGVLAVALAVRLADRGWGRPAGAFAALTMALSPFWLHYAQEARMYTMLAAGTLAAWGAMEAAI